MELEGSLKAFSLPEVLQFLSMGKMTGVLRVRSSNIEIGLIIKQGKIVNSTTLDRSRKLGQLLVYRGILNRSDLEEVLTHQKTIDSDKLLGQILVERELVTQEALKETIRLQLEEEIWDLFSWQEGDFKFEQDADNGIPDVQVEIDIEPLLIEGSRRQDEWTKISKNIQDENEVIHIAGIPEEFNSNANPEAREGLRLSDNEWRILALINGRFDVHSIVNRGGLGKFETYRLLNSFLGSRLIKTSRRTGLPDKDVMALKEGIFPNGENDATARRKRRRTLFSGTKNHTNGNQQTETKTFASPIGMVVAIVNESFKHLLMKEEFVLSKDDYSWLTLQWENLVMSYAKADAIGTEDGLLQAHKVESFFKISTSDKALKSCYEDSLEALGRVVKALHKLAAQRLGFKEAQKVFNLVTENLSSCRIEKQGNFELGTFLEKYAVTESGD